MGSLVIIPNQPLQHQVPPLPDAGSDAPFDNQWVLMRKSDAIRLTAEAGRWKSLHEKATRKISKLLQIVELQRAKIKDLRKRLFGKKTEKDKTSTSEADAAVSQQRPRGQQKGSKGHGRTAHSPNLEVVEEVIEFDTPNGCCPKCNLPFRRNAALDEVTEIKEVEVRAYIRRVRREAHVPGCRCGVLPAINLPPPVPRLIPRSPYGVSFWVQVLVTKYHYEQPTHRLLEDLRDQGMPVSPGTVAGGLQTLVPLFKPLVDALHDHQMGEKLFNCDETRWEVFVVMEDKVGSRWYLWVNRSASVIFYKLAPNRSAAVPLAHFADLENDKVIVVCDRYSAYKKLARLSDNIILAYCWTHVRRDFLEAGIRFPALEAWTLEWKERIGNLYHLNHQRLEHWDSKKPLSEQNGAFNTAQALLAGELESVHNEAKKLAELPKFKPVARIASTKSPAQEPTAKIPISAVNEQRKIGQSLLNHWDGLRVFFEHPEVPMDNNRAENSIRGPVNGRKNYYGSGSLWSAELAAYLFSLFQTLELWKVPIRPWLNSYLQACADNGGKPPADITPFLPWSKAKDQAVLQPDTS